MTTKHLSIEGMHCAACVQSVENALGSVDGVDQAAANLLKHTATVQLSSAVADEEFRRAIESAGYTLKSVSEKAGEQSVRTTQNLSAKQYLRSLQIAGPLALLCMIISMSMMFTDGAIASAATVNILLFALTLPVIWSGRSFFSGAWKAARQTNGTSNNSRKG